MVLRLIHNGKEPKLAFYDGIGLTQYQTLAKRWYEMFSIISSLLILVKYQHWSLTEPIIKR